MPRDRLSPRARSWARAERRAGWAVANCAVANCAVATCVVAVWVILSAGLAASVSALDPRSVEVFLVRCESSISRRDITLFGNGTVRLRQGPLDQQDLYLYDLDPPALASVRRQIEQAFDDDEEVFQRLPPSLLDGDWVETCTVRVELEDRRRYTFDFARYDVPPLEVARLLLLAENLAELTRPLAPPAQLPKDYRPRPGDVLIDAAGHRYRVISLTSDKKGVELEPQHQPLRIFQAIDSLRQVFVGVEMGRRHR